MNQRPDLVVGQLRDENFPLKKSAAVLSFEHEAQFSDGQLASAVGTDTHVKVRKTLRLPIFEWTLLAPTRFYRLLQLVDMVPDWAVGRRGQKSSVAQWAEFAWTVYVPKGGVVHAEPYGYVRASASGRP